MRGNLPSSITLYDGQPTWLSISTIVLALTIAYATIQLTLDPLGHVPGPLVARFTTLWYARQVRSGKFHMKDVELHKIYGSVVRIGPQECSIDDPNSVKTLYGIGSKFVKADWYYASSSPHFEHLKLFALRDPEQHSSLKKKLARFYTMTYVTNYEDAVDRNVLTFCERLQAFSQKGETFDLGHWVQCLAFDVISEITFGRPFGFLEKGEDIDNLVESLERVQKYSAVAGIFPSLHYIITAVLKYDPTAVIPRFSIKRIQQRQELGPPKHTATPNDFLTTFLQLVENKDGPGQFSPEHIVASCGMNVTAGSDTTGISLASVFYYLAKHPESSRKVLDELESTFPDRDHSRCLSFKEAQALPYLQAVIKEALRLHPATGLPLARKVPKVGVSILGKFFHEGSVVGINPWVAHRNRDIFGEDPDQFRPERWVEADVDRAKSMERYWIPFGSGSRTCIGKNISMLEISKAVPEILQRFDIKLVEASEQMFHHTECDWFVKLKALFVTVKGKS